MPGSACAKLSNTSCPTSKARGADGRPHPGRDLAGAGRAHARHRLPQHAAGQPAPARVGRAHHPARAVGEQHRQAVGGEDGADHAGLRWRCWRRRCAPAGRAPTVDASTTSTPCTWAIQAGRPGNQRLQACAVLAHGSRIVVHVQAEVQPAAAAAVVIRAARDAAQARGGQRADVRRRVRPVRNDDIAQQHQTASGSGMPALAISSAKSSASGTTHSQASPVNGCTRPRRRACSAWRWNTGIRCALP